MRGSVIGHYRILSEIGRGGMAVVYKAVDQRLDRVVALKVLLPQLTADPKFVQRFQREASMAGRLNHANIVTIYDVGQEQGRHYIAMQFLEGQTLQDMIARRGALPLRQAHSILKPVASALDYAHSRGLVHRDIKPTNIIVGPDGTVTLTDFGIARAHEDSRLTGTGQMIGTPQYMAPEQVQGAAADARTDVYALGVVLYEMLTGRVPFQATTPMAVLHQQVYEAPPPARQFNPSLPDSVDGVLQVALAKDPGQRFQTAGHMVSVLEGRKFVPVPPPVPPPAPGPAPVPAPLPAPRQRPNWLLLAGAALVTLVVIVVLIILASGNGPVNGTSQPPIVPTQIVRETVLVTVPPPTAPPPTEGTSTDGADATGTAVAALTSLAGTEVASAETAIAAATEAAAEATGDAQATSDAQATIDAQDNTPSGMVRIRSGCFLQGSTPAQSSAAANLCRSMEADPSPAKFCALSSFQDEEPLHEVCLDDYRIDQFEVTNGQYEACVRAGACDPPLENRTNLRSFYFGNPEFANYPVVFVTWHGAWQFCTWAGKRLPTEAEWERAARGDDGQEWPWGDSFQQNRCNTRAAGEMPNTGTTALVGSYPGCTSPGGAMDMVGNVWEWVADWYDADYYDLGIWDNPAGPATGDRRVMRGSSWNSNSGGARAASRAKVNPEKGYFDIGFRCASD